MLLSFEIHIHRLFESKMMIMNYDLKMMIMKYDLKMMIMKYDFNWFSSSNKCFV